MTLKPIRPPHPLYANRVSGSLLYQFVLVESFHVHKHLQLLTPIVYPNNNKNKITEIVDTHASVLTASLVSLVGRSQGYVVPTGWGQETGVLNKLMNYFLLFSQATTHDRQATPQESLTTARQTYQSEIPSPKSVSPMQNVLRQTLLIALQCRDFLDFSREPGVSITDTQYANFMSNFIFINTNLAEFLDDIKNFISQFQKDENLLFFLLRYQKNIHELYGKEFLNSLLLGWFPNGFQELEAFLHDKYSIRSYHHVLPLISEKLALLSDPA